MALLDCLHRLSDELQLTCIVAHLEHGFRGQASLDDAEYVKEYCSTRGIACQIRSVDMPAIIQANPGKGSSQEQSRRARYEWYQELTRAYETPYVALGHHQDDLAETILIRILQGTSLAGLSGIAAVSEREGMIIIRPMLSVAKQELLEYCNQNGITPREDVSNKSNLYLRNKVRNLLLPHIEKEYNQNVKQALINLSALSKEDEDYFDLQVANAYRELVAEIIVNGLYRVNRLGLGQLHIALQRRVILLILYYLKRSSRYEKRHIDIILDWIHGEASGGYIELPGDVIVAREPGVIFIMGKEYRDHGKIASDDCGQLQIGQQVQFSDGSILAAYVLRAEDAKHMQTNRNLVMFDANKLEGKPLFFRTRKSGDRMSVLGMEGIKKVKDILIDAKIPVAMRDKLPIVIAGQDIIWIAGVRRSGFAPVTDDTTEILFMQYTQY